MKIANFSSLKLNEIYRMYKKKFKIFGVAKKEKVMMCNDPNSIEHIFIDLEALNG